MHTENAVKLANTLADISIDLLKDFSALVMKNTGQEYKTALGAFSSARGELRLLNVTTGIGGKSYMNYSKVPGKTIGVLCLVEQGARKLYP